MINFLKESTFAVKSTLRVAWRILKKEYLKVFGLCFMMFLIFNISGFMAYIFSDFNLVVSLLMAGIFLILYCGFQLTLFKFILRVIDEDYHEVYVRDSIPPTRHIVRFLVATIYFILCVVCVYGLIIIVIFPFAYIHVPMEVLKQVAVSMGALGIIFTWLRIAFFPFFIIDKDFSAFKSIKFSLAVTRGNFTKLAMLLSLLTVFQLLHLVVNLEGNFAWGIFVSLINTLLIIPLSSVALTVVYTRMITEYEGDTNPTIMRNII